jgi:hypothetical protein
MQACGEASSVTDEGSRFRGRQAVWMGSPPGPGFGMRARGADSKVFGAGARSERAAKRGDCPLYDSKSRWREATGGG